MGYHIRQRLSRRRFIRPNFIATPRIRKPPQLNNAFRRFVDPFSRKKRSLPSRSLEHQKNNPFPQFATAANHKPGAYTSARTKIQARGFPDEQDS